MIASAFAPAKVNLYLHVGAPDPDGYHPLSSLVVFADVGDRLTLETADRFAFDVEGPFADALTAGGDNLAVRAVEALARAAGAPMPPVRLTLDKQLPVAAGLGGGSSDAAAALRLVRDQAFPAVGDETLLAILGRLGADGPMCLAGGPVTAQGYGERLSPAPKLPELNAVLINPGVPCSTAQVFADYDRIGQFGGAERGDLKCVYDRAMDLVSDLVDCRNDLDIAAAHLQPVLGRLEDDLMERGEVLLARLSGSGATMFTLCADAASAASLAEDLQGMGGDWWVRACRLGGPWSGA